MAYLIGLVGDPHVAEDLFQEIWIKLSTYEKDDIQNTHAWCRGVAKNLVLHHWRAKGQQKINANSDLMDKIELAFEENEDSTGERERKDALQNCMKELPKHSKDLLDQKYCEGHSFAKLSKKLDKSENALMMSLSRIRRKLQECIELKLKSEGLVL
jgi:RNA polymerase sigma-70 factor (ECF subfamily)